MPWPAGCQSSPGGRARGAPPLPCPPPRPIPSCRRGRPWWRGWRPGGPLKTTRRLRTPSCSRARRSLPPWKRPSRHWRRPRPLPEASPQRCLEARARAPPSPPSTLLLTTPRKRVQERVRSRPSRRCRRRTSASSGCRCTSPAMALQTNRMSTSSPPSSRCQGRTWKAYVRSSARPECAVGACSPRDGARRGQCQASPCSRCSSSSHRARTSRCRNTLAGFVRWPFGVSGGFLSVLHARRPQRAPKMGGTRASRALLPIWPSRGRRTSCRMQASLGPPGHWRRRLRR